VYETHDHGHGVFFQARGASGVDADSFSPGTIAAVKPRPPHSAQVFVFGRFDFVFVCAIESIVCLVIKSDCCE
jgi:hypothetical protein